MRRGLRALMRDMNSSRNEAVNAAKALSERIQGVLDGVKFPSDCKRTALALSGYRLALEHHAGIIPLLDPAIDRTAAALALARPTLEAYARARWIETKAKQKAIDKIAASLDCFPTLDELLKLPEVIGPDDWLSNVVNDGRFVKALHSATHGGALQLNRVFLGDGYMGLPEDYWDEQLEALVFFANSLALQSALSITNLLGDLLRTIALRANISVSTAVEIGQRAKPLSGS